MNERPHVESYSSAWGTRRAIITWVAFLSMALALVCALAWVQGAILVPPLAAAMFGWVLVEGIRFLRAPSPALQARLDRASGVWILVSYLLAGYGAYLSKWLHP